MSYGAALRPWKCAVDDCLNHRARGQAVCGKHKRHFDIYGAPNPEPRPTGPVSHISPETRAEVVRLVRTKFMTQIAVAKQLGIDPSSVSLIMKADRERAS